MSVFLKTQRLELIKPSPNYFSALFSLYSDPNVMEFMGGIRSEAMTRTILTGGVNHWEEHGFGSYFVRDTTSSKIIGYAGLTYLTVEGETDANLGWVLSKRFQGKGLGLELSKSLIEEGFLKQGLPRITATTDKNNVAALKLLLKLGFTFVRETTVLFFGTNYRGQHFQKFPAAPPFAGSKQNLPPR